MTVYYSAMALLLAAVAVFPAAAQELRAPNIAAPPVTAEFGVGQPLGDFVKSPSLGDSPADQNADSPKASSGISGGSVAPASQPNFGGENAPPSESSFKPFMDENSFSHSGGGGQMNMLDMSTFLPTPQDVEESKPPPAPTGDASAGPEVSVNLPGFTSSKSLGAQEAPKAAAPKPANNRPRGNRNAWVPAPSAGGCGGLQVDTPNPC